MARDLNRDLLKFAKKNNVEEVKHLLGEGANPNHYDGFVKTALYYAAGKNFIEIAKNLVDAGADVNQRCNPEATSSALISAIDGGAKFSFCKDEKTGNVEMVKFLISKGANVRFNSDAKYAYNPLLEAFEHHNHEIAKMLIEAGADVNQKDNFGVLPIFWAIETILFDYTNMRRIQSENYEQWASILEQDIPVVGGRINLTSYGYDLDKIINALSDSQKQIILNIRRNLNRTNNIELLELVLDSGADLNLRGNPCLDRGGLSVGVAASTRVALAESVTPLEYVLKRGSVFINIIDEFDRNFYFNYFSSEIFDVRSKLVKMLIKRGADYSYLNPIDLSYFDCLMKGKKCNHPATVRRSIEVEK